MRTAAALVALVLMSLVAMAQAPTESPVVRTATDPAGGIVIGQPVRLRVQVLFPGEMPHPPLVKLGEAPGAQILRFETQAITISDRIDGRDYVGQVFEFVVFPRRPGEIAIPPPDVTLLDRAGNPVGTARGEATTIAATVPPGIDPSGPVLVADRVSASETWSPEPGATFREGGAITRTIHRNAAGVPALAMAEFHFEAPDGVRVYADPPVVEDRIDRGNVDGRRTDKVTYVFERAGRFVLPELRQPWWSLLDKQARTETLPGVTVSVEAVAKGQVPGYVSGQISRRMAIILSAAVALLLALILLGPRLAAFLRSRSSAFATSEAFARKALLKVASTADPRATYRALREWRDRLPARERDMADADPRLAGVALTLTASLFGGGRAWRGEDAAALRDAIGHWHASRTATARPSALPPLNPAHPLDCLS
jgi:hypothetical protein